MDTVARQLLHLGWFVRARRSPEAGALLLLVSRTGFAPTPATVHVLPHHHLGLEAHSGDVIDIDDIDELHHLLKLILLRQ